jgi:hypothetical protein
LNPRIDGYAISGFDCLRRHEGIAIELGRVDAFARRYIRYKLFKSLSQLPGSTFLIAALGVMEAYCKVNYGLQELPPDTALPSPDVFEHFVAAKKFAVIEERDSLHQLLIHSIKSVM